MPVRIDTTNATTKVRSLISNSFEISQILDKDSTTDEVLVLKIDDKNGVVKVRYILEKIFKDKDIKDYFIAENIEKEDEIVIFKKGDMQQIGLYSCMHCGMIFKTDVERAAHQTVHYFI